MTMSRRWDAALGAALLSVICGGATPPVRAAGIESAPASAVAQSSAQATQSAGRVAFTVNGESRTFEHLPADHNRYTPLASTITARPSDGAREQLSITFLSIDLKKQQYPTQLPPARGRGAGANPLAAMANVGLSYIDAGGREWAGPGQVRVDLFGPDGIIVGTFADVTLPHTDKSLPEITLTDGTFSVRISAPWQQFSTQERE
jgi:hypothetical protein